MTKLNIATICLLMAFSALFMLSCNKADVQEDEILFVKIADVQHLMPEYDSFGIALGDHNVESRRVRNGESLSTLLAGYGVSGLQVNQLAAAAQGTFNVRRIMSGRDVHFYVNSATERLDYMVYQPNNRNYVVFDLTSQPDVFTGEFEQSRELRRIEGDINGSLYLSLREQGGSPALVSMLANIFAWQVDFYRIRQGDRFVVVYDEILIEGEPVGVGRIHAARLTHRGRDFDAIFFEQGDEADYFDLEGNSLRKAFLRAPLEYTRISSRFTNRRFHPVLGRNMPHHGTDYAAPTGTPIRAVGDGQIVHAGYDRNNGNYIRIRHNSVYETGYLHMSRMANGMRRGARVTQGQIIGYVGATGLATGPHLCFRFWQNGQPVDPYRVEMPPSKPVADQYREDFNTEKDRKLTLLFPEEFEEPTYIFVATEPEWKIPKPMILF